MFTTARKMMILCILFVPYLLDAMKQTLQWVPSNKWAKKSGVYTIRLSVLTEHFQ